MEFILKVKKTAAIPSDEAQRKAAGQGQD